LVRAESIMPSKNQNKNVLAKEVKIVPWWGWALAIIPFVAAQWYFNIAIVRHPHAPAAWVRPLFGLLAGAVSAIYVLLIGYVIRDSKRRGMSPLLWSLVAILVPNLLGILLYFVLRQPLVCVCPQCGNAVQRGFNFCPGCSYKLAPSCPQCQRIVGVNDDYCPYCGSSQGQRESTAPDPAAGGNSIPPKEADRR
jgi:RNA polymerase subunit RPABC4/transcription elongation factor Spt4